MKPEDHIAESTSSQDIVTTIIVCGDYTYISRDGALQRISTGTDSLDWIPKEDVKAHCDEVVNLPPKKKDRYATPYGKREVKKKAIATSGLLAKFVRKV